MSLLLRIALLVIDVQRRTASDVTGATRRAAGRSVSWSAGRRVLRTAPTLLAGLLIAPACNRGSDDGRGDGTPILAFDTATVRIASASDTALLRVEVAVSEEEKRLGLMERQQLATDRGMIFLYDETQPASGVFWMFRTRIPLDSAYLDSTGTIRAIRAMEPCTSPYAQGCPTYEAGVPFRAALEVNRGYFAQRGLGVGDRVLLGRLSERVGSGAR